MPSLKLSFLGAPHIELAEQPLRIARRKCLALLAYLAVTGKTHSRETLATLLWPESSEEAARTSLRRDLALLRQTVGTEWVVGDRASIALRHVDGAWVDVHHFHHLLAAARRQPDHEQEQALLEEALALYRDDFLTGFTLRDSPGFDEWQTAQTEHLRRALADALERLVQIGMEHRDDDRTTAHARRWVALDPLHEPAQRALMQAYALAGRRADALRQYEECVRALEEALGIPPDAATTALFEAIRNRQFAGAPPAPDGTAAEPQSAAHNLPVQPTPLVGRTQELADIQRMLADPACRLLTLIGPGGIGKTRLAIAAADQHPGAVVYVPLQAVASGAHLPTAIADAAGIALAGHEALARQLLNHLSGREVLLVLDNVEHLLAATDLTDLMVDILHQAPGVKLLVTSRAALSVREEWLYAVGGLPVPELKGEEDPLTYDAVQLFGARARQVQREFRLGDEIEAEVAICRAVEGMPLAIELAASWLTVLDCQAIAARLRESLDILSTPLRNLPPRHQSIRATFDGSWELLRPEERTIFMRLSVFPGGFDFEAAVAVAGATLPVMAALVAKALVRHLAGRYQIHELLRQYGQEKLAASPAQAAAVQQAHSDFYMRFLAERRLLFFGPQQGQVTQAIGEELENVRQAWQWAVAHLDQVSFVAIRHAGWALHQVLQFQSRYREGADLFLHTARRLEAESMTVERATALVAALTYYSWFCIRLGLLADADRALTRARALCDQLAVPRSPYLEGYPLSASMFVALSRGDYARAATLGEEILQIDEPHPYPVTTITHYGLASAALASNDYARAKAHAAQGLALAEATGNQRNMTFLHEILGRVALAEGALPQASHHFTAAYRIYEELGEPGGIAEHLTNLAEVALRRETWHEAADALQRSHRLFSEIGDRGGIARTQLGLAVVCQRTGERAAARGHFDQALSVALEAQYTPAILSVLAAAGEFLLQNEAGIELGRQTLVFVHRHPACDARLRQRVLAALDEAEVAQPERGSVTATMDELAASLRHELATVPGPAPTASSHADSCDM